MTFFVPHASQYAFFSLLQEEKCDLNCLSDEALRKRQVAEEAVKALSDNDKTDHIFARFEILVDILEWDLIVWLSRNTNYSKIRYIINLVFFICFHFLLCLIVLTYVHSYFFQGS